MKLILTKKQAKYILSHIPVGKSITLSVADANKIIDNSKNKKKPRT